MGCSPLIRELTGRKCSFLAVWQFFWIYYIISCWNDYVSYHLLKKWYVTFKYNAWKILGVFKLWRTRRIQHESIKRETIRMCACFSFPLNHSDRKVLAVLVLDIVNNLNFFWELVLHGPRYVPLQVLLSVSRHLPPCLRLWDGVWLLWQLALVPPEVCLSQPP